MKKNVILISGKQGSGKTTLADNLNEYINARIALQSTPLSFASVIYEMHDEIRKIGDKYGIPRKEPKDGPLLQLLGTEWGRNTIHEDIWVRAAQRKVENLFHTQKMLRIHLDHVFYIFSDCRFENELKGFPHALKIRLECDREIRKKRVSMWRDNDTHPSETNLDKATELGEFDLILDTGVLNEQEVLETVIKAIHQ